MNITQVKQIPLEDFVEHLGGKFSHKDSRGNLWYYSIFRPEEKTASFKIDPKTNKWHDFGRTAKVDASGDILDIWTDYNNISRKGSESIKAALAYLRGYVGTPNPSYIKKTTVGKKQPRIVNSVPRYKILKLSGNIWLVSLKAEIARRNLTVGLVQSYLKQVYLEESIERDNKNHFYNGFAFQNDLGGYEISIPNPFKNESFKTVIGPKAITTIVNSCQSSVCIFEGFWDCLSYIAMNKNLKELPTLYVLNSVSLIKNLADKLIENRNSIQYIFLFLDNDYAGEAAQSKLFDLLAAENFIIGTKNHLYEGYKDLSECWQIKNQSNKLKTLI